MKYLLSEDRWNNLMLIVLKSVYQFQATIIILRSGSSITYSIERYKIYDYPATRNKVTIKGLIWIFLYNIQS